MKQNQTIKHFHAHSFIDGYQFCLVGMRYVYIFPKMKNIITGKNDKFQYFQDNLISAKVLN